MKYFIMKNKDIIPAKDVVVSEDGIAKYDIVVGTYVITKQSEIKFEMDDELTYAYEKKGLFHTKTIELQWIPKFNVSGSGTFIDSHGNELNLAYFEVSVKK